MTQIIESFKMALAALSANKLRAVLTTLGVVVGVTVVLVTGWAITGLDKALDDTIAFMGEDFLYIDKFDWGGGDWNEQRNRKNVDYRQFLQAKARLRLPEYVVPTADRGVDEIEYEDLALKGVMVFGTTHDYIEMLGNNVAEGRFFNEVEDQAGANVVVLGSGIVENLFGGADPIGRTIDVDGLPFTVIGTMPKRGSAFADFVDNQVIIPLRRYFQMFGQRQAITINVKAGGVDRLEDVRYEVEGVMRSVRSLAPGEPNDFGVNSQESLQAQIDQFKTAVFSIGIVMTGLSFLVGSIGIMNIMFVSVTERTKEIGLRKAVGATRRSILTQFLVEAMILCLIGAVIGLAITSGIAYVGSIIARDELDVDFLSPTLSPMLVLIAIVVAAIVGIMAGVIPAFRASRLDPVEALRSE